MEKMLKRILIKVCSSPPYQWVARKVVMAILRRAHKAPEVQERIKALQAAAPEERFYAYFQYMTAVGNEMAKSKGAKFDPPSPEVMQWMRFEGLLLPKLEMLLLPKLENGNATESDIEEFRRLAEEVMQHPQCPPESKKRIGDCSPPTPLCFFLAPTVHAQEETLPDAARPNKKVLLAGFSLLAAAETADAITTRQLLNRGGDSASGPRPHDSCLAQNRPA